MAISAGPSNIVERYDYSPVRTDQRAMAVATALFFMVGFLTALNDVIIPHLKSIFELNYREAILVQVAFFGSYFIFSYPGGKLVDWLGYKRAMVVGLLVMAAGALGFLPAAKLALFPIFLGALIVLAAGMTTVQVAVNPYVTVIGPAAKAASRLNLAQAFNSVGTFIAPYLGAIFILGGAAGGADRSGAAALDVRSAAAELPGDAGLDGAASLHWDRVDACAAGAGAGADQAAIAQ